MIYDYTHNGSPRVVSRPATGCMYLDGVSIPSGATDVQLAALGLTPHVEPPAQPPADPQTLKSLGLKQSENRFILFCRSLNLPDVAGSADFEGLAQDMEVAGLQAEAMVISIKALALINDVTQNNGKWSDIAFHPEII